MRLCAFIDHDKQRVRYVNPEHVLLVSAIYGRGTGEAFVEVGAKIVLSNADGIYVEGTAYDVAAILAEGNLTPRGPRTTPNSTKERTHAYETADPYDG